MKALIIIGLVAVVAHLLAARFNLPIWMPLVACVVAGVVTARLGLNVADW